MNDRPPPLPLNPALYVIGYIRGYNVDGAFMDSVVRMIVTGDEEACVAAVLALEIGVGLCAGRNELAAQFMEVSERTGAAWLLMVDADMVFPADVFRRMRDEIEGVGPEMVGAGLYYSVDRKTREMKPCMFHESGLRIMEWMPGDVVDAHAAGTGCMLIHRDVFEKLEFPWFRVEQSGKWLEDVGLCKHFQSAGIRLKVHTGLNLLHCKGILAGDNDYRQYRASAEGVKNPPAP